MDTERGNWLEEQLERDDLSDAKRSTFSRELDQLMQYERVRREKRQEKEQREHKRREDIMARLHAGDASVVDVYGEEELGKDYVIIVENGAYVVYSHAATDGQNSRWVYSSEAVATAKRRKLMWDRLYTAYVRSGEVGKVDDIAA